MNDQTRPVRSLMRAGALLSICGTTAVVLGATVDLRQALFSYLVAWAFGLTSAVGALALLMIGYITHAKWLIAIRRLIEAVVITLPCFALLFVPIAIFARDIYLWAAPSRSWTPHVAAQIQIKQAYLNLTFWRGRALFFLLLWSGIALLLRRWSVRADREDTQTMTSRRRALSGAMAPVLPLTFTFAAFDWMMSLDPEWTSNAYGFYVFSAGFVGASAVLAILVWAARRSSLIPREVSEGHFQAVGNILFASNIFWAYIAFVQLMLIWIADLPEEVSWYATRVHGTWGTVCWCLGLGHFALPFLALLSRKLKRDPRTLALLGCWLLIAHYLDMYWLIMPTLHATGVQVHWLDFAALAAVAGSALAFGAWRYATVPSVPTEPDLAESLRFEMT